MNQLRGIVMCGGESKRMGTDKGLIPIQDTVWSAFMARKLSDLNIPVSIAINSSQIESYSSAISDYELIVDSQNIAGPLNGLLSAHTKYPTDDLLLQACDMINMKAETLSSLINHYNKQPGFDYYVYQNEHFAEPLCGIYTTQGFSNLLVKDFALSGLGFQKILNSGNTLRIPITEHSSFNNHNTY